MAPPEKTPAPVSPPSVKAVESKGDELEVFTAIGMGRTPRGWCVCEVSILGDQVVDMEILHGPDSKTLARDRLRMAVAKRILLKKN